MIKWIKHFFKRRKETDVLWDERTQTTCDDRAHEHYNDLKLKSRYW